MILLRLLLVLAIGGVFLGMSPGGGLHAEAPDEAVEGVLRDLATAKRAALLELNVVVPGRKNPQPYFGTLISPEGLALVDLSSLVHQQPPRILTTDGTPVQLLEIIGMFPAEELALVKLEHRPKTWIEPRVTEPDSGELLAVLFPWDVLTGKFQDVPPLIGSVVTRRVTMVSSNQRVPGFLRVLSFGGVLSPVQAGRTAPGVFAIDAEGKGAGVWGGTNPVTDKQGGIVQTLLLLNSMAQVAEKIPALVEKGRPVPRKQAGKYIKTYMLGEVQRKLHLAQMQSDGPEYHRHLRTLLEVNPDDEDLRQQAILANLCDLDGNPLFSLDDFEVNPADSVAAKIEKLTTQATIRLRDQDFEGAEAALRKIVAISPEGYFHAHVRLAGLLVERDRLPEASKLFEQAYDCHSDNIAMVGHMEALMISLRMEKRAAELSERVWELEAIYRRR